MNAVEQKIEKLLQEEGIMDTIQKAIEDYKNGPAPDLYNYGEPQPPVESHAPVGADSNETNSTEIKPKGVAKEKIRELFGGIKLPKKV